MVPMSIFCHAGHYYSSQGSQLSKAQLTTPPTPAAYRAPPCTRRASQQEVSVLLGTQLVSACPTAKVYDDFSNGVLQSSTAG